MQEVVERVRAVVAAFDQKSKDSQIERIEQLSQAIADCRKYVDVNEKNDRGCAQRLARELDEILSVIPHFRHLNNKQDMAARHTKKLAEDHLVEIQKVLDAILESDKKAKARDLREWVNHHPVFGPLRKACIKKGLPKDAFVLLFEKNEDGEIELMPRSVQEDSVLTRFRTNTFIDDAKVKSQFQSRGNVVGAALIADNKLVEVMGEVPAPTENRDHLQTLLRYSNEVASGPARQFVESNDVLNTLHTLAKGKEIPKDAYVLLFRLAPEAEEQAKSEQAADLKEEPKEEAGVTDAPDVVAEEHAPAQGEEAVEQAGSSETAESEDEQGRGSQSLTPAPTAEAPVEAKSEAETQVEEKSDAGDAATVNDQKSDAITEQPPQLPLQIVDKTSAEGKVITRFWSNDFVRKHYLFELFKDGAPMVGAAVIKERELLHAIGIMPRPKKNQSQLDAILSYSNKAVQRPSIEFVQNNEVLNGLNQLANDPAKSKDSFALLFTRTETTPYSLVSGKFGPRIPLEEFRQARIIHQRWGEKNITGAAVISEGAKPFVSAAFGRSPLKQNMLAVPENFKRLGLPVEIITPPPRREHSGGGGRDKSKGRPKPKQKQNQNQR